MLGEQQMPDARLGGVDQESCHASQRLHNWEGKQKLTMSREILDLKLEVP